MLVVYITSPSTIAATYLHILKLCEKTLFKFHMYTRMVKYKIRNPKLSFKCRGNPLYVKKEFMAF